MADAAENMDLAGTEPARITGGHLVAKALRNEGIAKIFTLSQRCA